MQTHRKLLENAFDLLRLLDYRFLHKNKPRYRPDIDALRAIAVIAVIINHADQSYLPSGFLGVDIFFVISGYVISSSVDAQNYPGFISFLSTFYARRIKRLLPALIVCIMATSLVYIAINLQSLPGLKVALASLFGLSNIVLYRQSTDYFADSTNLNPFAQTWSLGVEEQFYLVFPIVIWFISRFRNQISLQKSTKGLIAIATVSIISLLGFVLASALNPSASYYLTPFRAWELFAGVIAYMVSARFKSSVGLKTCALVLLLITAMAPLDVRVLATVVSVASTVVLVIPSPVGSSSLGFLVKPYNLILHSRPIVAIGLMSYSLYLWHWPLLSIEKWSSYAFSLTGLKLVVLIALIPVSLLSYFLLEIPFRHLRSSRKLTFLVAASVVAVSTFFLQKLPGTRLAIGLQALMQPVAASIEPLKSSVATTLLKCHTPPPSGDLFKKCLAFSTSTTKFRHIYVIGDSHATQLVPSIRKAISNLPDYRDVHYLSDDGLVMHMTSSGIKSDFLGLDPCALSGRCIPDSWSKHLHFFEENLGKGDTIFFSIYRSRIHESVGRRLPRSGSTRIAQRLEHALRELSTLVEAKGSRLVLVDDVPMTCADPGINFSYFVFRLGRFEVCEVPLALSRRDRQPLTSVYLGVADSFSSVDYLDLHDDLCLDGRCGLMDPSGNRFLFVDNRMHFSAENDSPLWEGFAKYLSNSISESP